jgi:hypothetical protein
MPVKIRSTATRGPVLVPLSSGITLRLAPGQVSDDLPDVEVANNAKVDKLQRQGVIDVAKAKKSEAGARRTRVPEGQPEKTQDERGRTPRARSRKRPGLSG